MSKITDGIVEWAKDTGERALRHAVVSFTSLTLGAGAIGNDTLVDLSVVQRASVAALGAAITVVLSAAAKWAGDPSSASLRK